MQQQSLKELADRMERELSAAAAIAIGTALSPEEVAARKVEFEQRRMFVESLRALKASGRMTIHLAHLRLFKGSEHDILMEDGDSLFLPQTSNVVNVSGSVMSPGAFVYSDKFTFHDYIRQTGGYSRFADRDNAFILKVDGSARRIEQGFFSWSPFRNRWEVTAFGEKINPIEPGDTIVIPERTDRIAWLREIRDITQVLMNVAVTTGLLLVLF